MRGRKGIRRFRDAPGPEAIKVGVDPLTPQVEPGYFMHVVNLSDHQVQLHDYGFFDRNGRLLSLPGLWNAELDDDAPSIVGGSHLEKRNNSFEIGERLRDEQVKAYAITTAQTRRTIAFWPGRPSWAHRTWLRCKIRWHHSWQ